MTNIEAFLKYMRHQLPGCPEPLALQHVVRAARDFCHQTHACRLVTDPAAVIAGDGRYDIMLPPETELVQVIQVWYGTRELRLIAPDDIGNPQAYFEPIGGQTRSPGEPGYAYLLSRAEIGLDAVPDKSASAMLTMRVAVKPTLEAETVPDNLFADWQEAVTAGAVASLAALPGHPFSSMDVATAASMAYRYFVSVARREAYKGRLSAERQVRMRPFA